MGVRRCSRKGCDSVMCDRHSVRHGYICGDCYVELENSGANTHKEIESFMGTPKFSHNSVVNLNREFQRK